MKGIILDKYYIPTRYPNGLPYPAVPYQSYTEEEANEAISIAEEIINITEREINKGIKE